MLKWRDLSKLICLTWTNQNAKPTTDNRGGALTDSPCIMVLWAPKTHAIIRREHQISDQLLTVNERFLVLIR